MGNINSSDNILNNKPLTNSKILQCPICLNRNTQLLSKPIHYTANRVPSIMINLMAQAYITQSKYKCCNCNKIFNVEYIKYDDDISQYALDGPYFYKF